VAALLWVGCDTTHDPFIERHGSEGWRVRIDPQHFSPTLLNQAMVADYKSYIASLSPEEQREASQTRTRLLEDGTGKQAVVIGIPLAGFWSSIWWDHILIYDTNNTRIGTLKYKSGRSIQ
jgi:hypothetical protein